MRSWFSRVREWLGVLIRLRTPSEFYLFLRISLFVLAVPSLLRLKLSTVQSLLEPRNPRSTPDPVAAGKILMFVDRIIDIARPLVPRVCLARGTALYYFLKRVGLDVSLCFGLAKIDGRFVGHCWLQKDERPFLEKTDPLLLFTPTYCIPHQASNSAPVRSIAQGWQ